MKFLLSVLMFLMVSVSLHAAQNSVEAVQPDVYPKKIVFGTYSQKSSAKYDFNVFRKDELYKKLYDLALKNNFMIHYRPLADYTILVMEPIQKRKVFLEAYALIKQRYPRAYHLSAEGLDVAVKKPLPPLASLNSTKTPCVVKKPTVTTGKTSQKKIEEPMFNVEEVSDAKMAVNCESTTKKETKKIEKPKEEVKPTAETMLASNDVKQQTAGEVQNTEVKKETTDTAQNQEVKKEVAQAVKPVEKSPEQKKESLLDSILKYFTHSKEKTEVTKPKSEVKAIKKESEVPALQGSAKAVPDDMDVPALDEPPVLSQKQEQPNVSDLNKTVETPKAVEKEEAADTLKLNENSENNVTAQNDANVTLTNSGIEDKINPEMTQDSNQTQTVEKPAEAVKKESPKEESYFTFSNIMIVLLLIFSPFLYRKLKSLKSVYDQY